MFELMEAQTDICDVPVNKNCKPFNGGCRPKVEGLSYFTDTINATDITMKPIHNNGSSTIRSSKRLNLPGDLFGSGKRPVVRGGMILFFAEAFSLFFLKLLLTCCFPSFLF